MGKTRQFHASLTYIILAKLLILETSLNVLHCAHRGTTAQLLPLTRNKIFAAWDQQLQQLQQLQQQQQQPQLLLS